MARPFRCPSEESTAPRTPTRTPRQLAASLEAGFAQSGEGTGRERASTSFQFGSGLKRLACRQDEGALRSQLLALFADVRGPTVRLQSGSDERLVERLRELSTSTEANDGGDRREQVDEALFAVLLELRELSIVVPHPTLERLEHAGFRVPARVWSATLDALRKAVCRGVRELFATTHGQVTHVRRPTEAEISSTMADLLDRCTPTGLQLDRGALFGDAIELTLVELARSGVVVEEKVLGVLEATLR